MLKKSLKCYMHQCQYVSVNVYVFVYECIYMYIVTYVKWSIL